MCPTNPQKDLKSRKGNEPFWGIASEMEFSGSIDARRASSELTPCALCLTIKNLSYTLWCIAPQVKRSSNDLPAEADLRAGGSAP